MSAPMTDSDLKRVERTWAAICFVGFVLTCIYLFIKLAPLAVNQPVRP